MCTYFALCIQIKNLISCVSVLIELYQTLNRVNKSVFQVLVSVYKSRLKDTAVFLTVVKSGNIIFTRACV